MSLRVVALKELEAPMMAAAARVKVSACVGIQCFCKNSAIID